MTKAAGSGRGGTVKLAGRLLVACLLLVVIAAFLRAQTRPGPESPFEAAGKALNLGQYDQVARLVGSSNDPRAIALRARIDIDHGRYADAERYIQKATGRGKGFGHFHHTTYHIACAYAQMNRVDEAVKWLETTAETGFPCYPLFEHDKNLDKVRDNVAFQNFLSKTKQQWEKYRAVASSGR